VNIVFIDHHLYPDDFFNEFTGKMKIYHDINKCATSLAYDVLNIDKESLKKISYLIETYDIWKNDRDEFSLANTLNNYFWYKVESMSIEYLMHQFIDNDWKLPKDFISSTNTLQTLYKEYIDNLTKRNLIFKTSLISIIFGDKYHNLFLIDEFKTGKAVCLVVNDYGIIRIRINDKCKLSNEQKQRIRLESTGNEFIGHMNAFTTKVQDHTFINIMKEVERIVKVIERELKEI